MGLVVLDADRGDKAFGKQENATAVKHTMA